MLGRCRRTAQSDGSKEEHPIQLYTVFMHSQKRIQSPDAAAAAPTMAYRIAMRVDTILGGLGVFGEPIDRFVFINIEQTEWLHCQYMVRCVGGKVRW